VLFLEKALKVKKYRFFQAGGEGRNRTHLGLQNRPTTVLKTAEDTSHSSLSDI